MNHEKIAYIAFDIVPAPKGAAIHIAAFIKALATTYKNIHLLTVSPTFELIDDVEIFSQVRQTMLPALGKNLIMRVLHFRQKLAVWLQKQRFDIIHIRSIYEGYIIAINKHKYCDKLVFEVNGLPSIELKYRYPKVAEDYELIDKLTSQEQVCLAAADLIITPSVVTAEYLQKIGISADKIQVIPNGVDLDVFSYQNPRSVISNQPNLPYQMLYFGTLSAWQGVNLAVEALGLINRDLLSYLTVIGQARDTQIISLKKLAAKLGIEDKLIILQPMLQKELIAKIHQSDVILAPLTANDRNLIQGCCPLKILEGMATGIPVITSDIPVVQELGENRRHFLAVKPGSAKAIKDAVLELQNNQQLAQELAVNARQRIEEYYTWERAGVALISAYKKLYL